MTATNRAKWELVRCLRYGSLVKLFRHRWGNVLPDDDAGRGDLWELVTNVSLAIKNPDKKIGHVIDLWAPWMPADEAAHIIEHVKMLTSYERTPTAEQLGRRLRVTNADRLRLKLWQFKPIDATDDEVAAQARERRNAKRRAKRGRTVAEYLAACLTATKPWLSQGICRRTWERRRAKGVSQVAVPIIVTVAEPRVATAERGRGRKGLQGSTRAEAESRKQRKGRTDRTAPGSSELVPRSATTEGTRAQICQDRDNGFALNRD